MEIVWLSWSACACIFFVRDPPLQIFSGTRLVAMAKLTLFRWRQHLPEIDELQASGLVGPFPLIGRCRNYEDHTSLVTRTAILQQRIHTGVSFSRFPPPLLLSDWTSPSLFLPFFTLLFVHSLVFSLVFICFVAQKLRRSDKDEDKASVHGLGDSVMRELKAIYETGESPRLDGLAADPKVRCLELFQKIGWVGPVKARELYGNGIGSIEELRAKGQHLLTEQARICLSRYVWFCCGLVLVARLCLFVSCSVDFLGPFLRVRVRVHVRFFIFVLLSMSLSCSRPVFVLSP